MGLPLPGRGDRRGWVARLTDAGLTALGAAEPTHAATVRQHLFDALTPTQVAALAEIGRAIQDGLGVVCASARAAAAGVDGEDVDGRETEEIDTGMDCPLEGLDETACAGDGGAGRQAARRPRPTP